jgi:GMP synthase-like glutamine amidotransferase
MDHEVLIIKNSTTEGPGLLAPILEAEHIGYQVTDLDKNESLPPVLDYKAFVVLGGPGSANDIDAKMTSELEYIRQIVSAGKPYLGICLGMQALVKACGGTVIRSPVKEVGFRGPDRRYFQVELTDMGKSDPIFHGLEQRLNVFHLHGETVEPAPHLHILATGRYCHNQVLRIGQNAYGLQCHFELTPEMLEDWIFTDPDLLQLDPVSLRKDFMDLKESYAKTGNIILNNFLKIAGLK